MEGDNSTGLFPGSSLDIRSLHLDSKHLCQITLNLPVNAFASKIAMWIIVLSPFTKYALTMNPLARSLEEFLPHRISSTTWCFMLLRTILVMATHLTGFLIPYYGLVMALIGSLLSTLVMRAKRAVVAMLARSKESVKIEDINMTEEERTEEERTEKEQKELMPLLMGGKLKSYQLKGVKWLISLQNNMY